MNTINAYELVRLIDNPKLNERYIRFKLNLDINEDFKYKQTEIDDINEMLDNLELDYNDAFDFYYSFCIKHLDAEFDLIKTGKDYIIDIEIKHKKIDESRIKKQLKRNAKYLKFLHQNVISFSYIAEENKVLVLNDDFSLVETDMDYMKKCIIECFYKDYDINHIFSAKEMLVSPFNNVEKFLDGKYLLTDEQENISSSIISKLSHKNDYYAIVGKPGTGKTLLLYDLVKKNEDKRILVIHCGQLCQGHNLLKKNLKHIDLIGAKKVSDYLENEYDLIVVDEAQRFYKHQLDKMLEHCVEANLPCIFSLDPEQRMMKSELSNRSAERIIELSGKNVYELPKKIRISNELNTFIQGLFDRKKRPQNYPFKNIDIIFEPKKEKLRGHISRLSSLGYNYISYTNSRYSTKLDYQDIGSKNTHNVIGQEFNSVCMIIDKNFSYDDDNKLTSSQHPNNDYLFEKLLYQGLTRARDKIALIVMDENMLDEVLQITKIKF